MAVDADTIEGPARLTIPVLIGSSDLTAATSYTTPTWAANAYRKINIEFSGTNSANTSIQFIVNADTATTYWSLGDFWTSADAFIADNTGGNAWARVALLPHASNGSHFELDFYPATNGSPRVGRWRSISLSSGAAMGENYAADGGFGYDNLVTDVTSITLTSGAGTISGRIVVTGYPL